MSAPKTTFTLVILLLLLVGIAPAQNTTNFPRIGHVDRFDASLDKIIGKDAVIEVLCGGFEWAEGPVWVPEKSNKFGPPIIRTSLNFDTPIKFQYLIKLSPV